MKFLTIFETMTMNVSESKVEVKDSSLLTNRSPILKVNSIN